MFFRNVKGRLKRIGIILLIFSIISIYFSNYNGIIQAATKENYLIKIGTGNNILTIKTDTEISEIESWYDNCNKLVTDSLYGGKAYSFWNGNNYENYLYIETLEDGRIFSYGSSDPTYKTQEYSYGDNYPWYQSRILSGCILPNGNKVGAGIYYNKMILFNGKKASIVDFYRKNFEQNQQKAMLALNKHATIMFNSIRNNDGKTEFITFNEEYFYINQQFREIGTSLQSYMYYMNYGYSYYSAIGTKSNVDIEVDSLYILNPLQFAGMAATNGYLDINERIYPVWDYDYEKKKLSGAIYSPTCFDRADEVLLTEQEILRCNEGRQEYAKAMDYFSKDSNLYEITPIINTPSELRAGKLLLNKQNAITHYLNAIRVAGGLGRLSADTEGFNVAQHLATLLSYRFIELNEEMQHVPAQPEGVRLEYYRTAIGYGTSWTSNLAYSAKSVSNEAMMHHINILLQDEDSTYNFGHRTYLLYPTYTKFGYGISPYFGVVELTGGNVEYDSDSVGWPSVNGVTFLETLPNNKFKWTCRFVSKYEVLRTTTAKIKCLNTGEEWSFTEEEEKYNRVYQNLTTDREGILYSVSNKVLMYDHSIEPRAGYVYEVTINGLKNTETGNIESYSYRTVFENAEQENKSKSGIKSIYIIQPDDMELIDIKTNTFEMPVGKEMKLRADIELDGEGFDNIIKWTSSDESVVTVTQNGIIKANKESTKPIKISAYSVANPEMKCEINIIPSLEKIILKTDRIRFSKIGETIKQEVSTSDGGIPTNITWTSVNPNIATVDNNGNITAKKPGFTYINVSSENYGTASCSVYVGAPIELKDKSKGFIGDLDRNGFFNGADAAIILDIFKGSNKDEDQIKLADVDGDGYRNATDSAYILDWFKTDAFSPGPYNHITGITLNTNKLSLKTGEITTLTASISLENMNIETTDSPILTWATTNQNVATVDENGNIIAIAPGTSNITVTTSNGKVATCTIDVSNIEPSYMPISNVNVNKNTLSLFVENEEILEETITPNNATNKVVSWSTNNSDVATVDENGKVTALEVGKADITVTTADGKTTTCTVTVSSPLWEELTKGDVNQDGKINLYDAIQVLKEAIMGGKAIEEVEYIMDINNDGKVNLYDAIQVLKKAILG